MVYPDFGMQIEGDAQLRAAQRAFHASERAERARRDAHSAQRSAAGSFDKSADSHERTAKAFEEAAEHCATGKDGYRQQAAHQREFAVEDRRMAQRLRDMA